MVRICMVAYTDYAYDSRVRREAESLVDRGDTVDVIALRKRGEDRVRILQGVRVIQPLMGRYRGGSASMYLVNYCLFFVVASVWLALLHLKNPYQVIQVHTMPDFMVFVAMIPKLLGAKILLDVHDLVPELYQSKFGLRGSHWLVRLVKRVERWSIAFADRAIAVHEPHLRALIQHGNPAEKFAILLNLPDPKIFTRGAHRAGQSDSSLKLIYHGTVAERHGLETAVRAIADARQVTTGLRLLIIGEGDGIPRLIQLLKELELTDCVELRSFVPNEELVPAILEADIGIVPILLDDFTKYMLPVKLLEYVAIGIPAICSRTETIEAYFDDTMVEYFPPGDINELARHIELLSRNPDRRRSLRVNADRFNQAHNWGKEKSFYFQLIDDLIRE